MVNERNLSICLRADKRFNNQTNENYHYLLNCLSIIIIGVFSL